jgi:hypothetical protein
MRDEQPPLWKPPEAKAELEKQIANVIRVYEAQHQELVTGIDITRAGKQIGVTVQGSSYAAAGNPAKR